MKPFLTSSSALIASLAVLQLASKLPVASAKPSFVVRIPNGANVPGVPAVGHADPEGSTRETNAFGDDFEKAGKKWTVALCQMDSDGDGQTNGQELGDPCCEWTAAAPVVRWSDGVSDPGVKTKASSTTLLASVSCLGTSFSSAAASPSPAAPASTPAASKATANSNPTTSSSSSSSAAPSASATKAPTASTANSTAINSTKSTVTTPKPTTVPTATAAATSAAPGSSLGFSAVTLLSAITLGAIAAIRD